MVLSSGRHEVQRSHIKDARRRRTEKSSRRAYKFLQKLRSARNRLRKVQVKQQREHKRLRCQHLQFKEIQPPEFLGFFNPLRRCGSSLRSQILRKRSLKLRLSRHKNAEEVFRRQSRRRGIRNRQKFEGKSKRREESLLSCG